MEKKGFLIADFTPEKGMIQFLAWNFPGPLKSNDTLQSQHILEV